MDTLLDSTVARIFKTSRAYGKISESVSKDRAELVATGLHGSLTALLTFKLSEKHRFPMMVVFPTEKEAEHFAADCESINQSAKVFPTWGALPYRALPQNAPVFGKRIQILSELRRGKKGVFATSIRGFCGVLPPPEFLDKRFSVLTIGSTNDPANLAEKLSASGYLRVARVSVQGEFAARGEVLDIFMPGEETAHRIVFDFDKINEIRPFDPITQTSYGKLDQLVVHPFREILWNEETTTGFMQALETLPEFKVKDTTRIGQVIEAAEHGNLAGDEYWFPLAFEKTNTLADYLPSGTLVIFAEYERLYAAADAMVREFHASYRKARIDQGVIPRPERLILHPDRVRASCPKILYLPLLGSGAGSSRRLDTDDEETVVPQDVFLPDDHGSFGAITPPPIENVETVAFGGEAPRSFFGNIQFLKDEIAPLIAQKWTILVLAESEVQVLRLKHMLDGTGVEVVQNSLSSGFALPEQKVLVIQEHEIFGRRKRIPQSVRKIKSQALDTFIELEPGDYVVHVQHGIGRFLSIKRIKAGGTERDYVELEYAGEEFVFVPIEQVNLVQRFIGNQGDSPRLDTIGGKSWEHRKSRVKKNIEELANHLIALYGKRMKARGYAFPPDGEWQIQFEASFPYEETEDQVRCIEEVKSDMEKPLPMDRLVCGDVGYGKTEIALRAAFKAVSAGKQVAFLSPTTILTEQHFETLQERLQGFPIKIGMMSRFVLPKEQKRVLEGLANGEVDLVVGTHRILQKDVHFKDLGLMIVDEEQRFGVKDKEKLKEIKANVDCLTMTATPIPRTLHMSLLKIRDMSVLNTAPYNRKPIETFVQAYDDQVVINAIRGEVGRGGQVFYLHNRVETLDQVRLNIERLVPEVLVDTAHGQMGPVELEDIMHRFINGAFHVLVATTIIENGINIPNVNTIIIDRADMYGVSQLYQLRGRVGRSGRLAYAYLLYPGERALSELAMKRLQIISDHTELGSGFKIALKDLEVRGAGNLLGAEQSGDILSVGFDMYLRLLDEAVRRLSDEEAEVIEETYLDLEYTGFIPDGYVHESAEKMEVYKKIASVQSDTDLEAVYAEISDRFGPPPDEVQSLMSLAELRILARKLRIASLRERKGILEIEFAKIGHLNLDKIMRLIQQSGGRIKPDPKQPNILRLQTKQVGLKEKSEYLRDQLTRLL